jgi:Xaa-Pro aminopeptidase
LARLRAKFWASFDEAAKTKEKLPRVSAMIGKMRAVKSEPELVLMRKSLAATVAAHTEALKSCEPGMWEYEIQSLVEYIFARNGCEAVAYNSIVGSGENSCVLHYETDRKQTKSGEIICMDVGGEYHGYASDVTRSYPVNGKFSPEQKAIYEIVLEAQEAGIAACKTGASWGASDAAARKIVGEGLVKLGIVKSAAEARNYFMHGTSHGVGLDVHDPQNVPALVPNVVLTVEPGIYIKEGSPCDKKWWNIGVRIEDCILVTPNGPVILSGKLPRRIVEIEALMAQKGLGNSPAGKVITSAWKPRASAHSHDAHAH